MTFSLTTECLFCGIHRLRRFDMDTPRWETILGVWYERTQHEWESKKGAPHRSGWVVTVCRACRKLHTIEELIERAKEVY